MSFQLTWDPSTSLFMFVGKQERENRQSNNQKNKKKMFFFLERKPKLKWACATIFLRRIAESLSDCVNSVDRCTHVMSSVNRRLIKWCRTSYRQSWHARVESFGQVQVVPTQSAKYSNGSFVFIHYHNWIHCTRAVLDFWSNLFYQIQPNRH